MFIYVCYCVRMYVCVYMCMYNFVALKVFYHVLLSYEHLSVYFATPGNCVIFPMPHDTGCGSLSCQLPYVKIF